MTQRHFIQNDVALLVTTVTRDRYPIFRDPACAREAVEHLYRVQERQPFLLFAFVVMPDHVHLLLCVPSPGTVSAVMRTYKMGLTFTIEKGPLWQARFHLSAVSDIGSARRYVHQNPVKAGLVALEGSYPWSSASGRWDVTDIF